MGFSQEKNLKQLTVQCCWWSPGVFLNSQGFSCRFSKILIAGNFSCLLVILFQISCLLVILFQIYSLKFWLKDLCSCFQQHFPGVIIEVVPHILWVFFHCFKMIVLELYFKRIGLFMIFSIVFIFI